MVDENFLNEVHLQKGNYINITGNYPDAIIISPSLFATIFKPMMLQYGVHIQDKHYIMGMRVYRSYDIEGFKVTKMEF